MLSATSTNVSSSATASVPFDEAEQVGIIQAMEDLENQEVDLKAYEEFATRMRSKVDTRPFSASHSRSTTTANASLASYPHIQPPQFETFSTTPTKPTRPLSARHESSRPTSASSHSGSSRKRRAELLSARVRAIYQDSGRYHTKPSSASTSNSITVSITNRMKAYEQEKQHQLAYERALDRPTSVKGVQPSTQAIEKRNEHQRLYDLVVELRVLVEQEQEKRVKAMARVRRLEEILAMRDRKIDALLQTQASNPEISSPHREMAQKDRQYHQMLLRLRQKIAEQSDQILSYEDTLNTLRSHTRSTTLIELEEENKQYSIDLVRLKERLHVQRTAMEQKDKKLLDFVQVEADYRLQIKHLQQQVQKNQQDKEKGDEELERLRAFADLLQKKFNASIPKASAVSKGASPTKSASSSRPPSTKPSSEALANALEEMKQMIDKATQQRQAINIIASKNSPKKRPQSSPQRPATATDVVVADASTSTTTAVETMETPDQVGSSALVTLVLAFSDKSPPQALEKACPRPPDRAVRPTGAKGERVVPKKDATPADKAPQKLPISTSIAPKEIVEAIAPTTKETPPTTRPNTTHQKNKKTAALKQTPQPAVKPDKAEEEKEEKKEIEPKVHESLGKKKESDSKQQAVAASKVSTKDDPAPTPPTPSVIAPTTQEPEAKQTTKKCVAASLSSQKSDPKQAKETATSSSTKESEIKKENESRAQVLPNNKAEPNNGTKHVQAIVVTPVSSEIKHSQQKDEPTQNKQANNSVAVVSSKSTQQPIQNPVVNSVVASVIVPQDQPVELQALAQVTSEKIVSEASSTVETVEHEEHEAIEEKEQREESSVFWDDEQDDEEEEKEEGEDQMDQEGGCEEEENEVERSADRWSEDDESGSESGSDSASSSYAGRGTGTGTGSNSNSNSDSDSDSRSETEFDFESDTERKH